MIHTKAEILLNQMVAPDHHKMVLRIDGFKGTVKPGQFFHIRSGSDYDPLLRRPLSIHRIGNKPNIIEILYKIKGKGTRLMSRRSKGTYLDVIGPLGNGFTIERSQKNFILVGGGMGIAPLLGLCDELVKDKTHNVTVVVGAKTVDYLLCENEFKSLKARVFVVTEDGTKGVKGLVTDALVEVIKQFDLRNPKGQMADKDTAGITIGSYHPLVELYTCGCTPMLREVSKICKQFKIKAQASLEERMGCGVGACLGCATQTTQGYKRVCKDGPVFNLDEVVL